MPKFYTKFECPPKKGVEYDPAEGRTQQQFKDECDIALTVKKYGDPDRFYQEMRLQNYLAGQVQKPLYGDFTELPDGLQEAMNLVHEAESMFMDLPAEVRERFANDPVQLIKFVQDPKNLDEAISLGIAQKRTETAQGEATVIPGATSPAGETQQASAGVSEGSVSHA